MVLALTCKITFHANERRKDITMHQVSELEFESSFKDMTDRGTLTLPRNVKFFDKYNAKEVFRRGDAVSIWFGYNGSNSLEFEGYVTEVSADIPVVIRFEDEMYKIKQIGVNYSAPNVTLEKLLKDLVPGYEVDVLEGVQLGGVRLSKTTMGPVLEKLKQDWGLYTFMRGKTLTSGKYYTGVEGMAIFHLEKNCVSTALNYRKKEDVSIRIKAVSTLSNGQKIEVEGIGDPDGNERQLTFYNITLRAELEKLGRLEYERYKVDRYDGSFTAFGIPSVRHGMKCEVRSSLYGERSGHYYIERVAKSFGPGGIRQEITLGERVTA